MSKPGPGPQDMSQRQPGVAARDVDANTAAEDAVDAAEIVAGVKDIVVRAEVDWRRPAQYRLLERIRLQREPAVRLRNFLDLGPIHICLQAAVQPEKFRKRGRDYGISGNLACAFRYFPSRNPPLGEIADNLRFDVEYPETVRVACLSLDGLAALGGSAQDAVLGTIIENLRTLGANKVIIDGNAALSSVGAPLGSVFFPTRLRPMQADVLSRAVWQIRSRGGADVYVRLPLEAAVAAVGDAGVPQLYADMLRASAADGIVVEASSQPGSTASGEKGAIRARRTALDPARLDPQSRRALAI